MKDKNKFSPEEIEEQKNELILQWQDSKAKLEIAKANEIQLRKDVVEFCFDPEKKKGTEKVELGNGYVLKAVKKLNYGFIQNASGKVDKDAIEKALLKIEKDGELGELVAERLVKWTPDLSLTEYNQLSEKHKKVIDQVLVTKEATPSLELVEPKVKK